MSAIVGYDRINEGMRLERANYIDIMPHNHLGAVCTAATVHMSFAVNNFSWVEINPRINESASALFPVQLERDGASFPLPTRLGLGMVSS